MEFEGKNEITKESQMNAVMHYPVDSSSTRFLLALVISCRFYSIPVGSCQLLLVLLVPAGSAEFTFYSILFTSALVGGSNLKFKLEASRRYQTGNRTRQLKRSKTSPNTAIICSTDLVSLFQISYLHQSRHAVSTTHRL